MNTPPLFFMHIPKTAGLSIHWAMANAFPWGTVLRSDSARKLWEIRANRVGSVRFFSAHAHLGFRKILPIDPIVFAFLRNPFDRTVSAYWHFRNENPANFEDNTFRDAIVECKSRSFEDILFDPKSPALSWLSNVQTWYLAGPDLKKAKPPSGEPSKEKLRERFVKVDRPEAFELGESDLRLAKKNLERIQVFGIVEKMTASLAVLEGRFGFDPGSMPLVNVRKSGSKDESIDQRARKRVEDITALDMGLYEYALDLFEQRSKEMSECRNGYRPFRPSSLQDNVRHVLHREVKEGFVGGGWYPAEEKDGQVWCWNGLTEECWIDFRLDVIGNIRFEMDILFCLDWTIVQDVQLFVRGTEISATVAQAGGINKLFATIPATLVGFGVTDIRVRIRIPTTMKPTEILEESSDTRRLGFAFQAFHVQTDIDDVA